VTSTTDRSEEPMRGLAEKLIAMADRLQRAYGHLPTDRFPGPPGNLCEELRRWASEVEAAQRPAAQAVRERQDALQARPPIDEEPWVVADDAGARKTFRDEDAAWRWRNEYTDRLVNPTVTYEPATKAAQAVAQKLVEECAPFLKDGETPAQCIARNRDDAFTAIRLYYSNAHRYQAMRAMWLDREGGAETGATLEMCRAESEDEFDKALDAWREQFATPPSERPAAPAQPEIFHGTSDALQDLSIRKTS
jgi:hypothetical protein